MNPLARGLLPLALIAALVACSDEPEVTTEAEAPVAEKPAAPAVVAVTAPVAPPLPPSATTATGPVADANMLDGLDRILAHPLRSPQNSARDVYRHPKQTLEFFGLQLKMTVIEVAPGTGWYTEILAPTYKGHGRYIAAIPTDASGGHAEDNRRLIGRLRSDRKHFNAAEIVRYDAAAPKFGPPGSADMVLTFRNAHNWIGAGTAQAHFKAFADVLKPGGVLGVVDHRAPVGAPTDGKSGYVTEEQIIDLAVGAGLVLADKSEVNANPKDTKDYPEGVWALPPTLALGETDKAKYLEIGESDRMTLKFLKP